MPKTHTGGKAASTTNGVGNDGLVFTRDLRGRFIRDLGHSVGLLRHMVGYNLCVVGWALVIYMTYLGF